MAAERAGGLSTAAIERCIDNWADETQDGDEIPAARAALAALTGRVAALEGALLDETARRLWTERVLQDRHSYPTGWDWDVGPAVREHWTQVARERLGYARTVETLAELLARRDADAERAGALAAENAALRAALSGLLGGIDRDDRPHPGQSLCRGLHTLDLVDEAIALVVAEAGPGAAGARDEIERKAAAWDWAWEQSRIERHPTWFDERALLGNALAAVDALRAGGAGDKGAADGGTVG